MLIDAICDKCGILYENKIIFNDENVICTDCGTTCRVLPNFNSSFRLKYDNKTDICSWGAENYASSQYYSKQKEMCAGNIFPVTGRK